MSGSNGKFGTSLKGRRCLVTGGFGFGGTHLARELTALGAIVTVLDRVGLDDVQPELQDSASAWRSVQGDVRDSELVSKVLRQERIDTVFHLAAEAIVPNSVTDPFSVLDVNARGTFTVLERSRCSGTVEQFIFASSGAYYGDHDQSSPIDETTSPTAASNLYAASKAAGDLAVQGYAKTFGMRASACRFMNTYGPGDRNTSRLIPAAVGKLLRGEPYDFGDRDDGTSQLDFLFVGDMTRAYLAVADSLSTTDGDVFNFGSGRLTSIAAVARLVSTSFDGIDREPVFRGVPRTIPRMKHLDISRAHRILGWEPKTALIDGLQATIDFYRRQVQQ